MPSKKYCGPLVFGYGTHNSTSRTSTCVVEKSLMICVETKRALTVFDYEQEQQITSYLKELLKGRGLLWFSIFLNKQPP